MLYFGVFLSFIFEGNCTKIGKLKNYKYKNLISIWLLYNINNNNIIKNINLLQKIKVLEGKPIKCSLFHCCGDFFLWVFSFKKKNNKCFIHNLVWRLIEFSLNKSLFFMQLHEMLCEWKLKHMLNWIYDAITLMEVSCFPQMYCVAAWQQLFFRYLFCDALLVIIKCIFIKLWRRFCSFDNLLASLIW